MKRRPPGRPNYKHDTDGHLAQNPGETDDQRFMRHANVLWTEKMTRNLPRTVFSNSAPSGPTNPPITYPAPIISDVSPRDINKGTGTFVLTISGSGFDPKSTIQFGLQTPAATYINASTLRADSAPMSPSAGQADVTVRQPDGQFSNSKRFVFR